MDTRTNQVEDTPKNKNLIFGILGAVVLLLILWMVLSPRTPALDGRNGMNTPTTSPVTR